MDKPLKIVKEDNVIRLIGQIDELADFHDLFVGLTGIVIIDMEEVNRIDSFGIRFWVEAVGKAKNLQLIYIRCPPTIINNFNMFPAFLGSNAEVRSFYADYYCEECNKEERFLLDVDQDFGGVSDIEAPTYKCECGGDYVLDEDEDEYLIFLKDSIWSDEQSADFGRLRRRPLTTEVLVSNNNSFDKVFKYTSENIGEGGIFILGKEQKSIKVGDLLFLKFKFEIENKFICIQTEVRWKRYSDDEMNQKLEGLGLAFVNLDKNVQKKISEFVWQFDFII